MKKTLLLLSSLALLAGCASPRVADPRIVVDPSASSIVQVLTVDYGATKGSNPVVALSVKSTSGSVRKIQHRTVWFDPNGAAINTILSKWKTVTLDPGEVADLRAVAPRADAQGFRFEIRQAP